MINAPDLDTVPICSLALSWRSKMILRRKSASRLRKTTNDSNRSCPRKKIKLKKYLSGRKHKSLEVKQKTPHLDNSISFKAPPINLITSTPLQKSLIPDDNGRRILKNSNVVTTIKRKSSNRNISSASPSPATAKSVLGSSKKITRSMTSLKHNYNCRSTRNQTLSKSKLSANNLRNSESRLNPCQVLIKKISFNMDDSDVNDTELNSRKLSLRSSSSRIKPSLHLTSTPMSSTSEKRGRPNNDSDVNDTELNSRKLSLRRSSSRIKPSSHLTSTPMSSTSEKRGRANSRTKLKKADKDSNNNNITSLQFQKNSDFSVSNNMTLRSVDSSKKVSSIASFVEQSSVMNQDQTPCNNQNALTSKRCERKITQSKGQRLPKNKQRLNGDNVHQFLTPVVKKNKNSPNKRTKTIKTYSPSFVERHTNCITFCGQIPVDDLCLTLKHNARKVQSDIIPVKKHCLTSKHTTQKMQSNIDIPVDSLCTTRRSARKVQSDSKYKGPGKNTLKRKRAVIEAIKKADESYEDDIYEGKEFNHFKDLFIDPSYSEVSFSIPTPKFGFHVSPVIRQKTPKIADCFSPRAFALSRKMAEEYMYRRNKMRKRTSRTSIPTNSVTPLNGEKKKMTFNQVISDVAKVQDAIEKLRNDESDDDDDDSNLSF